MRIKHSGLFFAILSPFLSSVSTVFKGAAVSILGPTLALSGGSLLGAGLLSMLLMIQRKRLPAILPLFRNQNFLQLVVSRQIAGELLLVYAFTHTAAIKVIFLSKAEPYFVLLWFWLLGKENITVRHVVLLAIHIAGAVLLSTSGQLTSIGAPQFGDMLILLAMAMFSWSYFPAKKLSRQVGAVPITMATLLVAGVLLLPITIFLTSPSSFGNISGWGYLFVQTILFTTTSLTLWFASLKTVKGWMVSALRAVGPLVGAPFAFFFFGQTLTPVQLLGGGIVLLTSFLIAKEHLRKE